MHDLGKGYPGDHSVVGGEMARAACERLGLPAEETAIVEYLVRNHLVMSHLAFFEAGLSVQAARIGTYRDQVVDAFHVTTSEGRKVDDAVLLDRLARAIEKAAEPITGPGLPRP